MLTPGMKNSTDISIDLFRLANILHFEELKEEQDFANSGDTVIRFKNYTVYFYNGNNMHRDIYMLKWFIWDNNPNVRH